MSAASQAAVRLPSAERVQEGRGGHRPQFSERADLGQTSAERPFSKNGRLEDGFAPASLNSKEHVSPSRRFHLLLPPELEGRLRDFAASRGVALAVGLRELASKGLTSSTGEADSGASESPLLLATLLAAEHAVLMVASILPEGERRRRELAAQAAVAAQERVGMIEADSQ